MNESQIAAEEALLHEACLLTLKLLINFKHFSLCAGVRGRGRSVELSVSSLSSVLCILLVYVLWALCICTVAFMKICEQTWWFEGGTAVCIA